MHDNEQEERTLLDLAREFAQEKKIEQISENHSSFEQAFSTEQKNVKEKKTYSQMMAYGAWLFDMWLAGHGSYVEIERGIKEGKFTPGIIPENTFLDKNDVGGMP